MCRERERGGEGEEGDEEGGEEGGDVTVLNILFQATRDQEGLVTAISDDNDTCTISLYVLLPPPHSSSFPSPLFHFIYFIIRKTLWLKFLLIYLFKDQTGLISRHLHHESLIWKLAMSFHSVFQLIPNAREYH